ncbi:hypothetical protein ABID42_003451 [Arcicella rosea]|uniref:WG repeat-containing protein n=1 Tax=Arcicella rosea TaxID=502909 RepID=UPI00345D8B35
MKKHTVIIILLLSNFNLFAQKLIPYRKGNLWGYSDVNKTIIIKPEFDMATYLIDNQAGMVVKDKKVGLISAKGEIVIPIQYRYVGKDGKGYKAFSDTGKVYFDEKFNKIDELIELEPDLMAPREPYDYSEANGKKGVKDKLPVYDRMFDFEVNGSRYFTALKNGKYGVIDENENILIPFIYDFLSSIYNSDITSSNSVLLTGIGKRSEKDGRLKFEGKYGLHSLFNIDKGKPRVYLEPKFDLELLPNTNQYIDDEQFVCVKKNGKEIIWNIKTGVEYYED